MSFIAARVYAKPLLPTKPLRGLDIDTVLKRMRRDLLRRLKAQLTQTTFSDAAKKALARAIKIEVKTSSLRVTSNHPAFGPLVRGQRHQQMAWLTKAKRPIPIVTDSGKLIFRTATAKSMQDGKWVHPGRKPSDFVDKAKDASRTYVKTKLREEIRKRFKSAWARAR